MEYRIGKIGFNCYCYIINFIKEMLHKSKQIYTQMDIIYAYAKIARDTNGEREELFKSLKI